jgi:hypothetical protein
VTLYVLPDLAPSLVGLTPDDDGVSVMGGPAGLRAPSSLRDARK